MFRSLLTLLLATSVLQAKEFWESSEDWNRDKQGWEWLFVHIDTNGDKQLSVEEYRAFQTYKKKNPNWQKILRGGSGPTEPHQSVTPGKPRVTQQPKKPERLSLKLVAAAAQADWTSCHALVKTEKVTGSDHIGNTALHWAAEYQNLSMTKALLSAGADPVAANRYGVTPFAIACTHGDPDQVLAMLNAGATPDRIAKGGEPPLLLAARSGSRASLQHLLQAEADVNIRERHHKQTALMWAAAEGHQEMVGLLLKAGAEVKARSKSGFTALLFAVRQGHSEVVGTLIAAGANPDQVVPPRNAGDGWKEDKPTGSGPSALAIAIVNAHFELANQLLDAGADPNFRWQGRCALHELVWVRKPGVGSNAPSRPGSGKMRSLDLLRRMAKHGADLNIKVTKNLKGVRSHLNTTGATPFLLAACTADAPMMRLLAELGADPHIPNSEGSTPLMVAAGLGVRSPTEDAGTEEDVLEAIRVALELGNDINAIDKRGETPMHGAAYKHLPKAVQLLHDKGADINIWNTKNKNGWTPLRIATGVFRSANFRYHEKTAETIAKIMRDAGVSTEL